MSIRSTIRELEQRLSYYGSPEQHPGPDKAPDHPADGKRKEK